MKARQGGESGPKASRQAMDGLSAGLGGQPIRPQRSSRRQSRPALPTTMMIFIVRCDLQSWGLYENQLPRAGRFCRRLHRGGPAARSRCRFSLSGVILRLRVNKKGTPPIGEGVPFHWATRCLPARRKPQRSRTPDPPIQPGQAPSSAASSGHRRCRDRTVPCSSRRNRSNHIGNADNRDG